MKFKERFSAVIRNHKLFFANQQEVDKVLGDVEDCQVWVDIETKGRKRTDHQSAFYWAAFIPAQIDCLKQNWGETFSKTMVHDINKIKIWGRELITPDGEAVQIPDSSTKNTTIEWEEKLEAAREYYRIAFSYELPYPEN